MQTRIILTITHKAPIPDLTDKVAGRVWSLQGVEGVEAVLDDLVKFLDEEPKLEQPAEPAPSTVGEPLTQGEVERIKAFLHLHKTSALPDEACKTCQGEGEIGGQFSGGMQECPDCAGSGKAAHGITQP